VIWRLIKIVIRNDREYREAQRRIKEHKRHLAAEKEALEAMGLSAENVKYGLNPLKSFHLGVVEEVRAYERLKAGYLPGLASLESLGRLLVEARIVCRLTQRELAKRLGINETQVSRDENNDYHGVTVERANRILNVLGLELSGTRLRVKASVKAVAVAPMRSNHGSSRRPLSVKGGAPPPEARPEPVKKVGRLRATEV
jgi:transcriptional regulator with XRE-family HTH domain